MSRGLPGNLPPWMLRRSDGGFTPGASRLRSRPFCHMGDGGGGGLGASSVGHREQGVRFLGLLR